MLSRRSLLPHKMGGERGREAVPELFPYRRAEAVEYAHRWAYGRNPAYDDFEALGGDCTNFASQCLYAGAGVMNFTPTFGWYYRSLSDRAPAWTGVEYLFRFLTRRERSPGPVAVLSSLEDLRPGDLVQLSFSSGAFTHCPVVIETGERGAPETLLLAAHSQDANLRPLASYPYRQVRGLHILGVTRV